MSDHFHELSRPDATVTVRVGDVIIARSSRTVLLEEVVRGRKLDPVHYFPAEDVSLDVLQPSATRTHCPIKGDASYWGYTGGAEARPDLAWAYPDPIDYSKAIAGHLAFDRRYAEIDVVVDQ